MSELLLAGEPLMHGNVPLGEAIAFWILAPICLGGAFGMVLARNAVHSALSLVLTMMTLGAFYVIQQGPFIGLVQIIVYTGAIMILFLFVLMLVGRDSSDSLVEVIRGQRWAAVLFGIAFALLVALSLGRAMADVQPANLAEQNRIDFGGAVQAGGGDFPNSNVHSLAERIFTEYVFAFELTSALLIVAALGAMVLAHHERETPKLTQKEVARARFRSGRPQTWTGPGVLSSGNAVGTPALLPDGSISRDSVLASTAGFPRELAIEAGDEEDEIR